MKRADLVVLLTVSMGDCRRSEVAAPSTPEKGSVNAMPLCKISISSPVDAYRWNDKDMPIVVEIVNGGTLPVQLDRNSLVGITINGAGSSYNLNKHLSPRPGDTRTLLPGETSRLRLNLKDYWQGPEPPSGQYAVTLRFLIEGTIQTSNEMIVNLHLPGK